MAFTRYDWRLVTRLIWPISGKRISTAAVSTELHIQSPARPSSRPLGSFSYNTATGCGSADWHFHLFGWEMVFTYAWCD